MANGHHVDEEGNRDDVGPGFMSAADHSIREGIQGYLTGFILAVLLTAGSFYVVRTDLIWAPAIVMALVTLAVAQIGVHLIFFLHLTTAPDNTNNILALAFAILVVVLIVGGSLFIMGHLNGRMMPISEMMNMQR